MASRFRWTTFDVSGSLPPGWQHEFARWQADADFREFPRTPVLSREAPMCCTSRAAASTPTRYGSSCPGSTSFTAARSWTLAGEACAEQVVAARDDRYGVVLNVQRGTAMRFECHVDSNPLTGLLFCTDHLGGRRAGDRARRHRGGLAGVERDCSVIRPHAGHLIFFDARRHPHYARPLTAPSPTRGSSPS